MTHDFATDTEQAQRLFRSLEGMEGMPPPPPGRGAPQIRALRRVYPGLLAAVTAGLAATWLSQHYDAPVMLYALLFGMAFHFLHEEGRCVAGIEFASKTVLRIGVALLGARITIEQIITLGVGPIATVVVGVLTTLALGALAVSYTHLTLPTIYSV